MVYVLKVEKHEIAMAKPVWKNLRNYKGLTFVGATMEMNSAYVGPL